MDTEKLQKLADIQYPESIAIKLPNDKHAVIGPFNFDVIAQIEKKHGNVQELGKILTDPKRPKMELLEIVYMILENQDDFESVEDFAASLPVMAMPNLMQIVYHFMQASMPDPEAIEELAKATKEIEGKKQHG